MLSRFSNDIFLNLWINKYKVAIYKIKKRDNHRRNIISLRISLETQSKLSVRFNRFSCYASFYIWVLIKIFSLVLSSTWARLLYSKFLFFVITNVIAFFCISWVLFLLPIGLNWKMYQYKPGLEFEFGFEYLLIINYLWYEWIWLTFSMCWIAS